MHNRGDPPCKRGSDSYGQGTFADIFHRTSFEENVGEMKQVPRIQNVNESIRGG